MAATNVIAFCFASFQFWQKFEKNPFLKEFVNDIRLIIGDHEYINIAEIDIEQFYSAGILGAKIFSCTPKH